jgi:hypothetical protein
MHSNFVTPPDFISTVLIINATSDQIKQCGETVQAAGRPYNVYFYNDTMEDLPWLEKVKTFADIIIDAQNSDPVDYFTK